MSEQSGGLTFARPGADAGAAFPHLAARVTAERVGAIVAASRLVGMVCPGLHSIFSGFSFRLVAGEAGSVLWYRTREIDPRFRMVRMAVAGGGVEGEITAFARLPPVAQPTLAQIAARTTRGAYADAVVLVVGGSRGLGEVTAKACAAGGARVIVTYASGRAEAERVAQEIRRFGGACDIVPFDARGDVADQLAELPAVPSHLYYFATGPIALRRTRLFSADVLAEFTRFYATAFFETCETLVAGRSGAGLRAFYPSSVAVEVAPKGWTEYAMAKAAGEVLCREMNLHLPGVHVVMRRLPRILTDQTATVRRAEAAPVLEVILPIVAELQAPA
jgi:NAD(P)-dependent dehydrogenase (short-subunit alcohol dehydrogenase family)